MTRSANLPPPTASLDPSHERGRCTAESLRRRTPQARRAQVWRKGGNARVAGRHPHSCGCDTPGCASHTLAGVPLRERPSGGPRCRIRESRQSRGGLLPSRLRKPGGWARRRHVHRQRTRPCVGVRRAQSGAEQPGLRWRGGSACVWEQNQRAFRPNTSAAMRAEFSSRLTLRVSGSLKLGPSDGKEAPPVTTGPRHS
jgi:hypothetical protein